MLGTGDLIRMLFCDACLRLFNSFGGGNNWELVMQIYFRTNSSGINLRRLNLSGGGWLLSLVMQTSKKVRLSRSKLAPRELVWRRILLGADNTKTHLEAVLGCKPASLELIWRTGVGTGTANQIKLKLFENKFGRCVVTHVCASWISFGRRNILELIMQKSLKDETLQE